MQSLRKQPQPSLVLVFEIAKKTFHLRSEIWFSTPRAAVRRINRIDEVKQKSPSSPLTY